jgi:hypothetical protein
MIGHGSDGCAREPIVYDPPVATSAADAGNAIVLEQAVLPIAARSLRLPLPVGDLLIC